MFEYVDIYCERTAAGLLNEPLNAITNFAFIIAAFILWRTSRRQAIAPALGDNVLIFNLFLIGIGSGLFHTYATRLTEWLDVIPILSFQLIWLWQYLSRLFGFGFWLKLVLTLGYFFGNFAIATLPDPTHGSIGYLGSLLVILGLGVHYRHIAKANSEGMPNLLIMMAGVFIVSLTFRTFDMKVCDSLPIGSHFVWHCLNAVVLWGCGRCVINRKFEAKA